MNKVNFPLRSVDYGDAQRLAELNYLSHTVSFQKFATQEWIKSRDYQDYLTFWNAFLTNQQRCEKTWAAWSGEEIIGTVTIMTLENNSQIFRPWNTQDLPENNICCLRLMYVHPDYLRQGIGSQLMEAAVTFMSEEGYQVSTLITHAANARARTFYEAHGWALEEVFAKQVKEFFSEPEAMRKRARYRLDVPTLVL